MLQVSLVAVYLMLLLGLCAVNVVLTVFILRLHHRSDSSPVQGRFCRLITKLRRLLRYSDAHGAPSTAESTTTELAPMSVMSMEDDDGQESGTSPADATSMDLEAENGGRNRFTRDTTSKPPQVIINAFQNPKYGPLNRLRGKRDRKSAASGKSANARDGSGHSEDEPRENGSVSGKVVAETLDFLLFVVCTVLSLGTTFLCLLTLIGGSATNALDTSLT